VTIGNAFGYVYSLIGSDSPPATSSSSTSSTASSAATTNTSSAGPRSAGTAHADPGAASSKPPETEFKTEFHRICCEFVDDLTHFRDKYPLISVISAIAFGMFGAIHLFSFSVTNILTGVFLIAFSVSLTASLGRKVYNDGGPGDLIWRVWTSFSDVYFTCKNRFEDLARQAQKS